jgi:hypothetical protein
VSRVLKSTSIRVRLAATVGTALGAALVLAGCSAGQIAQTAGMEPAVNGGLGQAGDIAVRDVQFLYPEGGTYPAGASAPLRGVIINGGRQDDELVDAISNWGRVTITGDKTLLAGRSLTLDATPPAPSSTPTTTSGPSSTGSSTASSTGSSSSSSSSTTGSSTGSSTSSSTGSSTSSSTPTTTSSPAKPTIGKVSITLVGLQEKVSAGKTVTVTFIFRNGGQATVTVPIANPTTPRQAPVEEDN